MYCCEVALFYIYLESWNNINFLHSEYELQYERGVLAVFPVHFATTAFFVVVVSFSFALSRNKCLCGFGCVYCR